MADYTSSYTGAQVDAGVALANTATQPADLATAIADFPTDAEVASSISTHNSDSTSVHGIADTTLLVTTADLGTKMAKQTLTDNAIPKANGTAGEVQNSGVIIDDANRVYGAGQLANIQTGTTYTIALSDAGKLITMNNAAASTLTIPANASVAFPIGTIISILQLGAGQVTIAITSDTLYSNGNKFKCTGQYAACGIVKLTSTTWALYGNVST
jgi:hypothetical protein